MFPCSLKYTVFTRGTRAQRAKLWKETTIIFPTHFFSAQKNLCTCCKCKTMRCQKWNEIGRSDKRGKLLWAIGLEGERPGSPQQMELYRYGRGAETQRREMRDHKKGWRRGWTVTHAPPERVISLTWPLVCHHVTGPVRRLHPVRLHGYCSVLHVDKGIIESGQWRREQARQWEWATFCAIVGNVSFF